MLPPAKASISSRVTPLLFLLARASREGRGTVRDIARCRIVRAIIYVEIASYPAEARRSEETMTVRFEIREALGASSAGERPDDALIY